MNHRDFHIALVLCGLAAVAYLVAILILAGCRAALPPEPPYSVTHARDASRP